MIHEWYTIFFTRNNGQHLERNATAFKVGRGGVGSCCFFLPPLPKLKTTCQEGMYDIHMKFYTRSHVFLCMRNFLVLFSCVAVIYFR